MAPAIDCREFSRTNCGNYRSSEIYIVIISSSIILASFLIGTLICGCCRKKPPKPRKPQNVPKWIEPDVPKSILDAEMGTAMVNNNGDDDPTIIHVHKDKKKDGIQTVLQPADDGLNPVSRGDPDYMTLRNVTDPFSDMSTQTGGTESSLVCESFRKNDVKDIKRGKENYVALDNSIGRRPTGGLKLALSPTGAKVDRSIGSDRKSPKTSGSHPPLISLTPKNITKALQTVQANSKASKAQHSTVVKCKKGSSKTKKAIELIDLMLDLLH